MHESMQNMLSTVFWDVMPCSMIKEGSILHIFVFQRIADTEYLKSDHTNHVQNQRHWHWHCVTEVLTYWVIWTAHGGLNVPFINIGLSSHFNQAQK